MPAHTGNDGGSPAVQSAYEAHLRVRNQLTELHRVQQFLEDFCTRSRIPAALQRALDLALTEWLTNVISYGIDAEPIQMIDVRLRWCGQTVEALVVDPGRPFNPLEYPTVDTSVALDDKPIGGLGIHMIRNLMDRISYQREGGFNRVTMIKAAAESSGQ